MFGRETAAALVSPFVVSRAEHDLHVQLLENLARRWCSSSEEPGLNYRDLRTSLIKSIWMNPALEKVTELVPICAAAAFFIHVCV